jgi:hypothetical protein
LLSEIPYKELAHEDVQLPERSTEGAYDDEATIIGRMFVPEKY